MIIGMRLRVHFWKFELKSLNKNAEAFLLDNELYELEKCDLVSVELMPNAFNLLRDSMPNATIKISRRHLI